jgi:5'-deoxynucleotidase YfbR-like HD superfamily hydrolase
MIDLRRILHGYLPRMSHVYRYSSIPVHRRENIAEHSWWVSFLCMVIGRDLQLQGHTIDMEELLERALLHDVDETMSGDIIRSFKHTDAAVKSAIQNASEANVRELFDTKTWGVGMDHDLFVTWAMAKDHRIEGDILKFADQLAVMFYCAGEVKAGNQNARDVVEELYLNWFQHWHDHAILMQYSAQLFPNNEWGDLFHRDPEDIRPIMRNHSEGPVAEHTYKAERFPLS